MILLTIRLSGVMRHWKEYKQGWLDPFDEYRNIVFVNYFLFGKYKVFQWPVFREEVPEWAVIQRACLGSSYWKSKRPLLIDASQDNRIVKTIRL